MYHDSVDLRTGHTTYLLQGTAKSHSNISACPKNIPPMWRYITAHVVLHSANQRGIRCTDLFSRAPNELKMVHHSVVLILLYSCTWLSYCLFNTCNYTKNIVYFFSSIQCFVYQNEWHMLTTYHFLLFAIQMNFVIRYTCLGCSDLHTVLYNIYVL